MKSFYSLSRRQLFLYGLFIISVLGFIASFYLDRRMAVLKPTSVFVPTPTIVDLMPGLGEEYVLNEVFTLKSQDYVGCDFGIDGKEHFYVLNAHKRCVDIFMADGKMIRSMPITVSSRSKDLLVDEEGRFACLGSFNIYVFDAEGKPITVVNRVGIQAKHFSYEDGLLYGDGTNEIISDSKNVASSFVFPAKLDGKKFPEFGKWIVMGDKPLFTDRDGNTINYYSNEDYRWPKNDDFKQVRAVKCNREYKVLASIPYLQYKMNRHTQDLYFSKIAEDNLLHIMMYKCIGARQRDVGLEK